MIKRRVPSKYKNECNYMRLISLLVSLALFMSMAALALGADQLQSNGQQPKTPSGPQTRQQEIGDPALGPGDELTIWALGASEISDKPIRIDDQGFIDLPMLGTVHAAGLTVGQLREELIKRLKRYVQTPQVSIRVTDLHSRPISVIGAVNHPGIYQIRQQNTVVDSLSLAGWLSADAGQVINVVRSERSLCPALPVSMDTPEGSFSTRSVLIRDLVDVRRPEQNLVLCPDDIVSVPRADTVYVVGEVQKPGVFPIHERASYTVLQALSMAGGLTPNAAPRDSKILRDAQSPNRQEIPIDLKKVLSSKSQDTFLRAGDVLFVPTSVPKTVGRKAVDVALQLAVGIAVFRR
jgi:polysaccharide export outer membrane protein